jgi:glycosyltransferase involved in cell wall biosynthesis
VKVSVIVPAYNEEARLAGSLASIRAAMAVFEDEGWACELVVCDNNSTDGTAAIARAAGATVVFEAHNQIARARNAGAARAGGDWLIFVDADSHPSPGLFADVAREIRRGRCLAGGSTIALDSTRRLVRLLGRAWNVSSRLNRWVAGSFFFCEAAAFREAGGFSLELYAAEDLDLSRRLKRLARQRGRTIAILHRHPLRTSDRKIHLYSGRELFVFLLRTILTGGRTLRSARHAFAWYDGRREVSRES